MLELNSPKQGTKETERMDTSSSVAFKHRHNRDGSWDSICMKCFLTVETAMQEEDLAGAERSHDCAELLAIKTNGAVTPAASS